MGQAAILSRISKKTFEELEKMDKKIHFDVNKYTKGNVIFEGSFMAVEFILSKGKQLFEVGLIAEIFNPKSMFGGYGGLSNCETDDEVEAFLMSDDNYCIPYIDPTKALEINNVLDKISDTDIHLHYNAQELNDNGIYPSAWHNDDSENFIFNKRQLLSDLIYLKMFFQKASEEKDYIIVSIE